MAKIKSPQPYTFFYNKTSVEPQPNLGDLEGGLLILLIGIAVFALVSMVYLYVKRKYKDDNIPDEIEIEIEVDKESQHLDNGSSEEKL